MLYTIYKYFIHHLETCPHIIYTPLFYTMRTRVQIINQIITDTFKSIYLKFFNLFSSNQERRKKDDSYYDDNSVYDFKHGSHDDCDDRLPLV
jgi:hypothetical protein